MKILCICNHGQNRSGALARAIKDLSGDCLSTKEEYLKQWIKHEAIAIGAHRTTDETFNVLINWADRVIDMSDEDKRINDKIKDIAKEKYIRFYIGGDRWGHPYHPELKEICDRFVREELKIK